MSPPLACIEINSTFYDVLKLEKEKQTTKFIKYFDQHCFVAWFETLFLRGYNFTEIYHMNQSHKSCIT